MPDAPRPKATICVVNYKTEQLTRLCLRAIRKYTEAPYEVVVVDNDSGDASLDYLRSLPWIRLVERPGQVMKSGSWAHGTALDIGLEAATGEYFVAMHSDTFARRPGWLPWLLGKLEGKPKAACAGSGKLDLRPRWLALLRAATDYKQWWRRLTIDDPLKLDFYVRAICAAYRRDILMAENLRFAMDVDNGMTCGKRLYFELLRRGYSAEVIPELQMAAMVHHLAHATMAMNPEFDVPGKTQRRCMRRLKAALESPEVQAVARDSSLDS